MNPKLNILQWNCRSLPRRIPDLLYILEEQKINIASLCETRLSDNIRLSFANHELFTLNRNRQGKGVALLIDKKYRFSVIHDDRIEELCLRNEIELIITKIWIETDEHIYICLVYSPPRGNHHHHTETQAWPEILQFCSVLDPMVI
ncbi:hypothetical protein RF55_10999 [Lasius niger]|uniref:Uncharacterized protein n=1 Tax=Lasius niger TaxID=67767 RepID=A0A0J7KGK8_LASNI|nr:hypothetical protein RF55_10999 [Lasius niger]